MHTFKRDRSNSWTANRLGQNSYHVRYTLYQCKILQFVIDLYKMGSETRQNIWYITWLSQEFALKKEACLLFSLKKRSLHMPSDQGSWISTKSVSLFYNACAYEDHLVLFCKMKKCLLICYYRLQIFQINALFSPSRRKKLLNSAYSVISLIF